MSETELNYLQRVEMTANQNLTLEPTLQESEKQGEIIDLRNQDQPMLENDTKDVPKSRKLNFSIKDSSKTNEAKQIQKIKSEAKIKPKIFSLKSHLNAINTKGAKKTFKSSLKLTRKADRDNSEIPSADVVSSRPNPAIKVEKLDKEGSEIESDQNKDLKASKKKVRFKESGAQSP